MGTKELKAHCALDETTLELLKIAMTDMNLSARAYDRILKVARTIADLAASPRITSDHISEAIGFRSLDRQIWGSRRGHSKVRELRATMSSVTSVIRCRAGRHASSRPRASARVAAPTRAMSAR